MNCRLSALTFSIFLVLAAVGPAEAAKRLPITIDFSFDPSIIEDQFWSLEDISIVENRLRPFVLAQMDNLFDYWSFRDPSQPRRFRLEFWIRRWQGDSAIMLLVPVINNRAKVPVARFVWRTAGAFSSTGLAAPEVEAENLKNFVRNIFLIEDSNTAKIEKWLKADKQ